MNSQKTYSVIGVYSVYFEDGWPCYNEALLYWVNHFTSRYGLMQSEWMSWRPNWINCLKIQDFSQPLFRTQNPRSLPQMYQGTAHEKLFQTTGPIFRKMFLKMSFAKWRRFLSRSHRNNELSKPFVKTMIKYWNDDVMTWKRRITGPSWGKSTGAVI